MTSALRHGEYRKLAALYTANLLVDWFSSVALMVVVYRAQGDATIAALLLVCKQIVPGFLVPAVADRAARLPVGRALIALFIAQAIGLSILAITGYGLMLFVLAAVVGCVGAVVRSTLRTAIVAALPEDVLRNGNALLNLVTGVAAPVGPALAAASVALAGPVSALGFAAGSMALLALGSAALRDAPVVSPDKPAEDAVPDHAPVPRRLPLGGLLAGVACIGCLFSMDQSFLLDYSVHTLGAGVGGYGAIFAAWGVGITLGSVLFTRVVARPMLQIYASATVLSGVAFVLMAVSPSIAFTCAVAVVGGIGNGMDWAAIVTAVQEASSGEGQARAMARLEAIGMAAPGIGIVLGALLADLVGVRLALAVPGLSSLCIVAVLAAASRDSSPRRRAISASKLAPSISGGSA